MRKGIYGLVIENKKVLVVKKKGKYVLPGGNPIYSGEKDFDVLKREFRKDLSGTEVLVDLYYRTFKGFSSRSEESILTRNYFCYLLEGVGEPSTGVSSKKWASSHDLRERSFSELTERVLYSLVEDGLIE